GYLAAAELVPGLSRGVLQVAEDVLQAEKLQLLTGRLEDVQGGLHGLHLGDAVPGEPGGGCADRDERAGGAEARGGDGAHAGPDDAERSTRDLPGGPEPVQAAEDLLLHGEL